MANSYETANIYRTNLRRDNTDIIDNGFAERQQRNQDPVLVKMSSRAMIDSHVFRLIMFTFPHKDITQNDSTMAISRIVIR